MVGAGRDGTSIGAGRLTSFTADEEVELIVDVDSAVRGVRDDDWLGGNSRVVAGLPLVLRLASFFLFISISISASHDTFTGGGQTHSLKKNVAVPMKTRIKSTDNQLHYLAMCFLASYFALMKLSRVESVCGLRKLSGRLASYTALARLFPICCRDCNVV